MTEKDYAFRSLRDVTVHMEARTEASIKGHYKEMKELLTNYQKLITENQMVLTELEMECQEKINEDLAYAMEYLNRYDFRMNVSRLRHEMGNLMVIYGLSDMVYRAMILMKYYAPQGPLMEKLIRCNYCMNVKQRDVDIQQEIGIGRSKYYEVKKEAVGYMGFYFYEIVLPQATEKRYAKMAGQAERRR